jgi:hypothetical protein
MWAWAGDVVDEGLRAFNVVFAYTVGLGDDKEEEEEEEEAAEEAAEEEEGDDG